MHSYQLDVCDLKVGFRTEAEPERVERARSYVDELYTQLKGQGGTLNRDRLLAILLIGLADDVLQLRDQHSRADSRLDELLQSLKDCDSDTESVALADTSDSV